MSFYSRPLLTFSDAYAQPSDTTYGRKLSVIFDTNNMEVDSYGNFVNPVTIMLHGNNELSAIATEIFSITHPQQALDGITYFTEFSSVDVYGTKIDAYDSYGALTVYETNSLDVENNDGYSCTVINYGSGIFIIEDAYGNAYDPGDGNYEFKYSSPLLFPITVLKPNKAYFGNTSDLTKPLNGTIDEIKISTDLLTKSRSMETTGSRDISTEYTRPIPALVSADTLVLMHCNDNSSNIVDQLKEPLSSLYLTNEQIATIVSKRNNKQEFIDYINYLGYTGSITDGPTNLSFAEQLYILVSSLNKLSNDAQYYKLGGLFFPSNVTVNSNFEYSGLFTGESYIVNRNGLFNPTGSIEFWASPLFNLYGDTKKRYYLDMYNHEVLGEDGTLESTTETIIQLPTGVKAQKILSISLYDTYNSRTIQQEFSYNCTLISNGNIIILDEPLPAKTLKVIVDYVPLNVVDNRISVYKDEASYLNFEIYNGSSSYSVRSNVSSWLKNSWHRILITWKLNSMAGFNTIKMFIDGALVSTSIINQSNLYFYGNVDQLYIGTNAFKKLPNMGRLCNLRISSTNREPTIDVRGVQRDMDYAGGSAVASPVVNDVYTVYLDNFDPASKFIEKFAVITNGTSGLFDVEVTVNDSFKLVKDVSDGLIEKLLKKVIETIVPAHTRLSIKIL